MIPKSLDDSLKCFFANMIFIIPLAIAVGMHLDDMRSEIKTVENKIVSIQERTNEMYERIERNDRNFQAQMETDYVVARWKYELQRHLDNYDDDKYKVISYRTEESEGVISVDFEYCNFACYIYQVSEKFDVTGNSTVVIEKL